MQYRDAGGAQASDLPRQFHRLQARIRARRADQDLIHLFALLSHNQHRHTGVAGDPFRRGTQDKAGDAAATARPDYDQIVSARGSLVQDLLGGVALAKEHVGRRRTRQQLLPLRQSSLHPALVSAPFHHPQQRGRLVGGAGQQRSEAQCPLAVGRTVGTDQNAHLLAPSSTSAGWVSAK